MAKKPTHREIADQPAAGALGGIVAALLYDSIHAVWSFFTRRGERKQAAFAADAQLRRREIRRLKRTSRGSGS
jgi:hypothetical protein